MTSMVNIEMKDGAFACIPASWTVLNRDDARESEFACILSVPCATKEGASPFYVFFGNTPCRQFSEEQKEEVYSMVEMEWPHFMQIRMMEPPQLSEEELMRAFLAVSCRKFEEMGAYEAAEKARRMMNEPYEKIRDHWQRCARNSGDKHGAFAWDADFLQQNLVHLVEPNIERHGFFEIFPEGGYPFNEDAPYGECIKGIKAPERWWSKYGRK